MFEFKKEYHRKTDLHDVYGGQRQSGISTPQGQPFLFLFTSHTGEQYGYHDDFVDGIYHYTGEGQNGDMTLTGGNRAIVDHSSNGKKLFLFCYTRRGYVEFMGEAEFLDYKVVTRPDALGIDRKAFVFYLDLSAGVVKGIQTPKSNYVTPTVKLLKKKSIQELRAAALEPSSTSTGPKEKMQLAYYRSEALKLYVIARSCGVCEACNTTAPFQTKTGPYLECHHINRLSDGGPDHPENVIALCPNCHRRAHFATDAKTFNKSLQQIALEKEKGQI